MPSSSLVDKFSGTSIAPPKRIRRVVDLVTASPTEGRRVVLISGLGGVTNDLLALRTGHAGHVEAISRQFEAKLDKLMP